MDLLQYAFFQNALIGSLLTAIACGIVGTYIVSRRLVFISGGITHASFGGLGLGFYLGTNPILMAMLFSILSAFGVEWASKTQNVREDSAIAGVWSLGMALGVIFIFLTPGYAPNLSAYLFGNILTISTADILWILGLVVLLILIFSLFLREIVYVAFDRDFAVTQGLPVKWIEYTMMCFVRRFGLGFLSGNKPDLDGDAVLHPLRFWRGVGEQDAKRKGGFRYSGRMVAGYGFGSDLHLPYPGVRPESIRLSIW